MEETRWDERGGVERGRMGEVEEEGRKEVWETMLIQYMYLRI